MSDQKRKRRAHIIKSTALDPDLVPEEEDVHFVPEVDQINCRPLSLLAEWMVDYGLCMNVMIVTFLWDVSFLLKMMVVVALPTFYKNPHVAVVSEELQGCFR